MLRLLAIHSGAVVDIPPTGTGEWWDTPWRSGFGKQPRTGRVPLGSQGLEGDGQADLAHHGGPDKALCCYPAEHYAYWNEVLAPLRLTHGAFGENLTTEGMMEDDVCIGDVFHAPGGVLVQITQPRQPCWKLARRWRVRDLAAQAERTGRTGWYLRVLKPGHLTVGRALTLHERPHPEWPVSLANTIRHHRKDDIRAAAALAACPALSASWQRSLAARATGAEEKSAERLTQP